MLKNKKREVQPAEFVRDRRCARIEEILAAATRMFNRYSFAGLTMESVAAELQMSAGTLYHYFEDKSALIFQCYQRGNRIYEEEIKFIAEAGLDGLEVVRRFVRRRLLPGHDRMIVFSDVDALPTPYDVLIKQGRRNNVAALEDLITKGLKDGSIATCDARLTSISIFSVLDWMPFWFSERDYYTRQDAAEILDDILTHGVVRLDLPIPQPLPEAPHLAPLLERHARMGRREAKRDMLLSVATQSFNLKGVVGSSLESIAARAGVSRGAYYYHAQDKEELLYHCLKRAFEWEWDAYRFIIHQAELLPDEHLSALTTEIGLFHAMHILHRTTIGPKSNYHNINFLKPEQRVEILGINKTIEKENQARYKTLVHSGHYRKIDPFFMQQIGAGLRNNLPTWTEEAGVDPIFFANVQSRLFLFGLKARRS